MVEQLCKKKNNSIWYETYINFYKVEFIFKITHYRIHDIVYDIILNGLNNTMVTFLGQHNHLQDSMIVFFFSFLFDFHFLDKVNPVQFDPIKVIKK